MKQKALFKLSIYTSEHGGSLRLGKRKTARPVSKQNAMKIVLRGDIKKSGSLLKYRKEIDGYFKKFQNQFGVRVYKYALVSNHIHFVALFGSRDSYRKFIRALTGTIARRTKIVWIFKPWSRILSWGKAFKTALKYVLQNHLEAVGAISYSPRKSRH